VCRYIRTQIGIAGGQGLASPFCYAAYAIVQKLRQHLGLAVAGLPFEVIECLPPRGAFMLPGR
jgi:hypothetical protein